MTRARHSEKSDQINAAFLAACSAELQALKPGNVHVFAPGHDMTISHFEQSARAAAPIVANSELAVGARIKDAVAASMTAAGCNTNLGIILLCAPLAVAFERTETARDLPGDLSGSGTRAIHDQLQEVLRILTPQDAEDVFAAIRLANPGGLGTVDKGDVHASPDTLGLLDAMRLAAPTDRIANAYCTNFDDIFDRHLPVLDDAVKAARKELPARAPPGGKIAWDDRAVTTLFMQMLATFPDSHIVRKFGADAAGAVQARARALEASWAPVTGGAKAHQALLRFDEELKKKGLNPGTSADFVVATLFASQLCRFAAR